MQGLKTAAAVFCMACIGGELTAQLTGKGWPRRCIKAVAGLYILVVFAQLLPGAKAQFKPVPLPQASEIDLGTAEQAVLRQAEQQLETSLAEECAAQTGTAVRLEITLAQTSAGVAAQKVRCFLPAGCSPAAREAAADFLRGALGVEPELVEGGETEP